MADAALSFQTAATAHHVSATSPGVIRERSTAGPDGDAGAPRTCAGPGWRQSGTGVNQTLGGAVRSGRHPAMDY
jgi:hypothetical protein